jgi:hypothetical protein
LEKRHLLLPCLLLVSAFFLAACGGGGSSDEEQVEAAITTSATTADPANCTKYETLAFSEQSSDESGKAALRTCESEAKDPTNNAKSVEVTKVAVDGSRATANAAISGGGFDGQTVEIALVEEDGQWKLDEISGFAKLDTAKLGDTFRTQFEATEELTAEQTDCIVGGIEAASQAEVEEFLLSGSSTAFVEMAESCE